MPDAAPRKLLDSGEVAACLGVSRDWWYRHARRLRDRHGFPAPVPGFPGLYDPAAIAAWQDRFLLGAAGDGRPANPIAGREARVADNADASELDRRAHALAHLD